MYDFKKLLWKDEFNPRVRCAFGNVSNYKLTIAAMFNIMTLQAWRGLRRQRQAQPNDKSEKVADQKRPQATCQEFVISSRIFALTSSCTSGDI